MKPKVFCGKKSGMFSINFLLIASFLLISLIPFGGSESNNSEVVWKDNCQTRCVDGKCNTILGKTIWVNDSDGICRPIEKANSLKNGFFIEYLEIDPSFNLTVSEFNISYMDMTLNFEGNPADYPIFCQVTDELNAKCDFKLDKKWDEYDEEGNVTEKSQLKFQYKWELKQGEVIKGDKIKYELKENVMGKKFSFGGNSTTIQLQDADTENLEDTFLDEANPTNIWGANSEFYINARSGNTDREEGILKFNLSSIPSGQQIDSAMLLLYCNGEGLDSGESYHSDAHHVYNQTWNELVITWNIALGMDYNLTYESRHTFVDGHGTGWFNWTVTNMVTKAYTDSDVNFTVWLRSVYLSGSPLAFDDVDIDTKESTTSSQRPYLNITYSEASPEDTCNPTSPLTANYVFDCNDNCSQDATLNANGYTITWNNAGNYYLEEDIINVKNMTVAFVCNFIKGKGNITIMKN